MMYAVVDLEATSVHKSSEKRIIQIGITFIENNTIQDTVCIDINPLTPIDKRVVALTGITDEQVKHAPIFEDVAEYIYTLLEGCVFVAHNINFDYTLLKEAFQLAGYNDFYMIGMDTIELAKMIYPTQESYNLGQLAMSKELLHPQEHHAGSDSRVTAELFLMMQRDAAYFPKHLLDRMIHVLRYKEDPHAFFFETITPDVLNNGTIQDGGNHVQHNHNIKQFVVETSTQQEIVQYVQEAKHVVLEEVNPEIDLETVLPALYSDGNVMMYVSPHRSHTHAIEKALRYKEVPVEVIYPIHYYVNETKLDHILEHLAQVTMQEARQLCRVLVTMNMAEQPYQCITTSDINMRLLYWIGGMTDNGECPKGYMRQLDAIDSHTIVLIEQQTLIEQIHFIHQTVWFSKAQLYIPNVYKWIDTVQKNTSTMLYHTNHLSHLFGLSQRMQDTQHLNQIESVITGYQLFLKFFQTTYPQLFLDSMEGSVYQTSFIDSVSNIDLNVFKQFEKSVRLFKQLLEKYDRYKYKLHRELEEHILLLEQIGKMDRAYIVLAVHRKKYTQYSLTVTQYNIQEWLENTIYTNNQSVIYTKIGQLQARVDKYLVHNIHNDQVYYVQARNHETKEKIYVSHELDTSVMKDNLIIRKIKSLNKKWTKPTIFIVPSIQFLDKILEDNPEAYTVQMQQAWAKQTEESLYLTWEQWRQYNMIVSKDQKVVILKLPFESPYSISAQAYRFFEDTKRETYFDRVALPKMLMQLYECASSVTARGGKFIVFDHRILNSVYQEDITQTLSRSFVLEQVNIASLDETC